MDVDVFYHITSRWLPVLVLVVGAAVPARAQHGGHGGGHHYDGHGFGGISIGGHGSSSFGHHYSHSPSYHGVYYGSGYGAYGYNSWPYSYTPRVYAYSGVPTVPVGPQSETTHSHSPVSSATSGAAVGLSDQRAAESAFRSHHYQEAIELAKRAARATTRDGRLFLFLSQAHLAVGEYRDAAGAARLGMSLLPTENWGYVVKNFRRYYHDADYVAQVRRLRQFIAENPSHADTRFLLGYHWVFLGHSEAAKREAYFAAANRELSQAAELAPRDEWANRLLELVDGARPVPTQSVVGARPPGEPAVTSESPRSVNASVEYPPPQEFEKPLKSSGGGDAAHQHEHKE